MMPTQAHVPDDRQGTQDPVSPAVVPHQRLVGLVAGAFAHPYDQQAAAALGRLRGFDTAVGKLIEWQHEKGAHVELSASSVRVTPKQMPRLYAMLRDSCAVLDMEEPELYVAGGGLNALTSGHNHPYIVLYSDLVDIMNDAELQAVLAHELGHIKCQHVLYKEMVRWLANVGASATLSDKYAAAARVIWKLVGSALVNWDQKSELTADRAAMLVVQDEDVCIRMLLKLAGAPARFADELDSGAFLEQARHLQDLTFDSSIADSHRRRMLASASHPLTVERARLLDAWVNDGGYSRVMEQPQSSAVPEKAASPARPSRRRVPRVSVTFSRRPEPGAVSDGRTGGNGRAATPASHQPEGTPDQ